MNGNTVRPMKLWLAQLGRPMKLWLAQLGRPMKLWLALFLIINGCGNVDPRIIYNQFSSLIKNDERQYCSPNEALANPTWTPYETLASPTWTPYEALASSFSNNKRMW